MVNNNKFNLTSEDNKKYLNEIFKSSGDIAENIWDRYHKIFSEGITNSYLSHVVQSIQIYVRKKCERPLFQIELCPLDYSNGSNDLRNVLHARYREGSFFKIFFPRKLKEGIIDIKEIRLGIAHELGHLLYLVGTETKDIEKNDELFSSLFAIVVLANRSDFYEFKVKEINYKNFKEIVDTMSLIHNSKHGKYNISGS